VLFIVFCHQIIIDEAAAERGVEALLMCLQAIDATVYSSVGNCCVVRLLCVSFFVRALSTVRARMGGPDEHMQNRAWAASDQLDQLHVACDFVSLCEMLSGVRLCHRQCYVC
jgi:hypothetical protein